MAARWGFRQQADQEIRGTVGGLSARLLGRGGAPRGLTLLVGADEAGGLIWVDLRSPRSGHVLIVGDDPAARSELLRTAMMSLSLRASPAEVQLAGVDPSGRELRVLEALPHALVPLAERPQEADDLLAWLADECRRRLVRGQQRPEIALFLDGGGEQRLEGIACSARLEDVLRLGPLCGVHVVAASHSAVKGIPWASRTCLLEAVTSVDPGVFRLRLDDGRGTVVRPVSLGARDLDEAVRWIRGERGGHQPGDLAAHVIEWTQERS